MARLTEAVRGLRALEVTEERELAGRVAGLLYLTAAVTVPLLLVMPGMHVDSVPAALAASGFSLLWGLACLLWIPWPTVHPLVSHLSSAMGLPLTAITMAATGGAESPARFYLLFIVFYASYFYPPREAFPHLIGCIAVLLVPLAYDSNAVQSGLLAETLVLAPAFLVLGGLIMGGKDVMLVLSRHDPLTGLVNRRVFEQRLVSSVDGRASGRFGLMLCDLDSFKSVNDRHGHPEGDRVLRQTAMALQATVRAGDIVARVGGDEFAVVVDGADDRTMSALAERLRAELARAGRQLGLNGFELEASIGWALYPGDGSSGQDLVARADEALRREKGLGGNSRRRRVLAGDAPPPQR
jgi:diguanylate cyclase (GGDEF)-like protein